jgi:hypothetical protein
MMVDVSDARSENIRGERNGYYYELMQFAGNNAFVYKLIFPNGYTKLVNLDAEAVSLLVSNPQMFCEIYVQ